MKLKNGMYLFATAVVAGTMGLASCSSDEEIGGSVPKVKTTEVTMGVYVNGMPGAQKRSSADDVNMGEEINPITRVAVVPVANGAFQAPIIFEGQVTSATKQSTVKKVSLVETVDEFLVYGNVPDTKIPESPSAFTGFTIEPEVASDNPDGAISGQNLKKPYGLYYFKDATKFSTTDKEFDGTGTGFWDSGTDWTDDQQTIKDATGIKISDVGYAVGVLVTGVRQTTQYVEGQFENFDNSGSEWNTSICDKMLLKGIIVEGQPGELNERFEESGTDVKMYETVASVTYQTQALSFDGLTGNVKSANTYTIVAREDKDVLVTFQVQNTTGYTLNLTDGNKVNDGGYVYYTVKLTKPSDKNVFDWATTTLLNANITNWGNGTTTPPEKTDVFIGIGFDMSWKAGLIYNQDI